MKEHRNFSSLKWTGKGVDTDEMKWNAIVKESKMINTKQIIIWYTIGKPMVERATNTCILFRNIAAKQAEKGNACFTANHVQIRYWTSLYLTFNKLHSRNSLNLGNCHFPFTYKEDEKAKLLVFLSKLFLNLHFSSVSNNWKKGICSYFHTCYHLMACLLKPTRLTLPMWLLPRYNMKCSLRCRRNFISVSNVCEAAPISLFWEPKRPNELPEIRFELSFHSDGHIDNDLFKKPITARNQILVHRRGPRTKISSLSPRRTYFWLKKMVWTNVIFSTSEHYRHAMSLHKENHLSVFR